jgi:predicted ester cyclase
MTTCALIGTHRTPRPFLLLWALLLTGLGATTLILAVVVDGPATAGSTHFAEGEVIVRRYYAAINDAIRTGDLTLLDGIATATESEIGTDAAPAGCGMRCRVAALHRLAPEMRLTIREVVADGNRAAVRLNVVGADEARFLGLPLVGDLSPWRSVDFLHIADGKVAEILSSDDWPTAIDPLARAEIESVLAAPYRLGLVKLTIEPGASLPELVASGPLLLRVETGTLVARADQPVSVRHRARDGHLERRVMSAGPHQIAAGDEVLLASDAAYELVNTAREPSIVLAAAALEGAGGITNRWVRARTLDETLFSSADLDIADQASTTVPGPAGVRSELLVTGVIDTGSPTEAILSLTRLTLEPHAALPVHHVPGAELVLVEAGSAIVDLARGEGETRPRRGTWPEDIAPSGSGSRRGAEVAPGGSMVLQPGASAGIRNGGAEPLVLLILSLEPNPAASRSS